MVTIVETIDVGVPVGRARAAWNTYVTAMIVGSGGRLAPPDARVPWRREARDANDGAVQFAMRDADATRVTVALDFEPASEDESDAKRMEQLRRQIGADLHRFRLFAEGREARLRRTG
jgi:uncharacterized membrane protein